MRDKSTWTAVSQLIEGTGARTTQRAILVCGCEAAVPRGGKGYFHTRCPRRAPQVAPAVVAMAPDDALAFLRASGFDTSALEAEARARVADAPEYADARREAFMALPDATLAVA